MQRCKRLVSLLLVLCLALSLTAMGASALEAAPTEELDELEKLATDYVTAYIENIYLDGGNDLSKATVAELAADAAVESSLSLPMDQQVLVGRELTTLSKLCDNITFLDETAQYYGYLHTAQDLFVEDFTLTTTILDHVLEGSYAYIHLYALAEFRYPGAEITSAAGDHYYVEFIKTNTGWTIVDMTVEFLEAYGIKQGTFDLQASIQAADDAFRQPVVAAPESVETQAVTHGYSYNKNNAIAYSMVYTTSQNNDGHDGPTKDYLEFENIDSDIFGSYTGIGGNCQNYVSQCLYIGLGGSNTASKVEAGGPPMDESGEYQWYWKSDGDRYPSWTATDLFFSYAKNSFDKKNLGETGMRGSWHTISAGSNFSGVTTSQLLGSVLEVYRGSSAPDHAILIVEANGLERKDIKFNGNSPMRKAQPLGAEFPSQKMELIIPTGMDVVGTCTHSYTSSGNWTGVICKSCGYNRMRITASMPHWGMFRTGTTWTVTASMGFTCYRIAIGITDPSGNTSWSEYTNTGSVSRSYDFSQTGLYNIRISARNMPESYSGSASTYYDYTIRTYS